MCGIAGAISLSKQFNPHIIRGLIWANRERGIDSLGLFDSSGRIIKSAGDPALIMANEPFRRWIDNSARYSWAIGAHTRHATQGKITNDNAHPFSYGNIVGSHNGMVHAPNKYVVDSEYLFDSIAKSGYKELEGIEGYWGLSWFDKAKQLFWLTMHSGSLAYTVSDGVCYYSSDGDHLECWFSDVQEFSEGQVICFDAKGNVWDSDQGQIAELKVERDYWSAYSKSGYGGLSAGYTSKAYTATDSETAFDYRDDEQDWRESWSNYIHSMTDDNFEFQAWNGNS